MTTQMYRPEARRPAVMTGLPPGRSVVRWAGVVAGAAIAIGLEFLITSFWQALAYSSNVTWFADTINWWYAGTSIVTLFIAGLLAGWLAGVRGWGAGLVNGLTAWGLLIAGSVVFGVGSAVATNTLSNASRDIGNADARSMWPVFVAYAIGIVAAAVGGIIGGLVPRPRALFSELGGMTPVEEPASTYRDDWDDRDWHERDGRRTEHVEPERRMADRSIAREDTRARDPHEPYASRETYDDPDQYGARDRDIDLRDPAAGREQPLASREPSDPREPVEGREPLEHPPR